MKQVDIFKQKIFTGDKKQMLFFWKAIKNMNKYISVFLIFFLMPVFHPQDIYHPIILLHIILMQQTEVMITMEHLQIKLGKI